MQWGGVRSQVIAVLAAALLCAVGEVPEVRRVAAGEGIPRDAQPMPLDRTQTLRGLGARYYIDGAAVIPRTAEIRVERGVTIIGINGATLDVRGGLKMHGTEDTWITVHNVDFSTTSHPRKGLHLDMVDFRECRFKHGDVGEIRGCVTIENSCLQSGCEFDVRIKGGFLKIMTVEFNIPCRIVCDRQKENSVPIEIEVRSSWMKRIELVGPAMANFRHSEIRNGLVCRNVTQVTVDGCDLGDDMMFEQGPHDSFKQIKLTKCNLFNGSSVVLKRETGPDTQKERIKLDKFYFGPKDGRGITDKKEVAERVKDSWSAREKNIKATWNTPKKRMHVLVNYDTLRTRAPPLK